MRDLHLKWKLLHRVAVPAANLLDWAEWFETADRVVAKTIIGDVAEVSTVFLGLDHNFNRTGDPLLFETMVFAVEKETFALGGRFNEHCPQLHDLPMSRYSTWEQAEKGHEEICAFVRQRMEAAAKLVEVKYGKAAEEGVKSDEQKS
jgi:hypothetical protein